MFFAFCDLSCGFQLRCIVVFLTTSWFVCCWWLESLVLEGVVVLNLVVVSWWFRVGLCAFDWLWLDASRFDWCFSIYGV